MQIQSPKGTRDILPSQTQTWQWVEEAARSVFSTYGYQEIRTPIFESTELFVRGVGDTTDIVEKEMYTFNDKADRSITLRPEGTAPVVRAILQNRLARRRERLETLLQRANVPLRTTAGWTLPRALAGRRGGVRRG